MACKDHIFIKVVQMSYFLKNGEDKLEIKCGEPSVKESTPENRKKRNFLSFRPLY